MCKMLCATLSVLFFTSGSVFAEQQPSSFEIHNTKIDESVKVCPKSEIELANEILRLELAGRRYLKSKPSCFKSLLAKYIHTSKNPDEAVEDLVVVEEGSEKIESVEYNKKFFNFKVVFSVRDTSGKTVKDSFSFMTMSKPGAKKPRRGCASISSDPLKAFVNSSCL